MASAGLQNVHTPHKKRCIWDQRHQMVNYSCLIIYTKHAMWIISVCCICPSHPTSGSTYHTLYPPSTTPSPLYNGFLPSKFSVLIQGLDLKCHLSPWLCRCCLTCWVPATIYFAPESSFCVHFVTSTTLLLHFHNSSPVTSIEPIFRTFGMTEANFLTITYKFTNMVLNNNVEWTEEII